MAKFGFLPSTELLETMHYGLRVKNSGEGLTPIRNEIALSINEEILTILLIDLMKQFPSSDKSETGLKLARYLKASVVTLLQSIWSDAPNKIAKTSIEFYGQSLFKAADQQYRVGFSLDPRLFTNLQQNLVHIQAGERVHQAALAETYKQWAEAIVRHFLTNFSQTLELDMLKAKTLDSASSTLLKAIYIALDKIIMNLNRNELKLLANYHLLLLHSKS